MIHERSARRLSAFALAALLAACSNGTGSVQSAPQDPSPEAPTRQFTVSATVSGLVGSGLVLQLNGEHDLPVAADGVVTFPDPLEEGASYTVTVIAQPANPAQICSIGGGAGVIVAESAPDVRVSCVTQATHAVRGSVSGLLGSGLVLRNNDGDDLPIARDGAFRFLTELPAGAPYNVTVAVQPDGPRQTCTVANAAGVMDEADVTNVQVACVADRYTIGGSVSGLAGAGLVLRLTAGGERAEREIAANGRFDFPLAVRSGVQYVVSIAAQPRDPSQTCTVENASGVVAQANVTNVQVVCANRSFTLGGTVRGLEGSGLVLREGAETLAIVSNGAFTFPAARPSGSAYEVVVQAQPVHPDQTCTIANARGTIGGGDVSNIRVSCATRTHSIGGAVSGLLGRGLRLQNNSGDDLEVRTDGPFVFPRQIASGAAYNVTVRTQPSEPGQTCTVENGRGLVADADVSNVLVGCTTSTFTVGGAVSGLGGGGLVLRNNGADDQRIDSDGRFTFATALPSGASYDVTIAAQPDGSNCVVENGGGVVSSASITNVRVLCVSAQFRVGGVVSGLEGSGLRLQNNGGEPFAIAANGPFTAPGSSPNGSPYNITVARQPSDPQQTCVVTNGAGTLNGADVTDVSVVCSKESFTIGGRVSGMTGIGLSLENNGGDRILIASDGAFTFPTPLRTGQTYDVNVATQPLLSRRKCEVERGAGVVEDRDVKDVRVRCR